MTILQAIPVVADFFSPDAHDSDSWRTGLHSGNIGDIVYALPTCRMLEINHLILNVCADPGFGGRVLTEQAAKALVPLLLAQKYIRRVTIIKSGVPWEYANPVDLGVDYILDSFRSSFTNARLHLLYAHATPYSLMVDGALPWITLDEGTSAQRIKQEPYIVVGLTSRYRRFDHAYYEYLFRDVPADRVFFVGVGNDQIERRNIGGTVFQTTNFMELAKLLANSALFIGNPSFAYALAEGLKVERLVEVPNENNVYPLDSTGSLLHMTTPETVRKKIFNVLQLEDRTRISWESVVPERMLANMPFMQIYFDSGSGHNEFESIRKTVVRGPQRYVFDGFPENCAIGSLRFDPVNDHTIVRINKIRLTSDAGEQIVDATAVNAAYVGNTAECYFTHGDPQFLVQVPAAYQTGLKKVTIDIDIIAIGSTEVIERIYPQQFEILTAERSDLMSVKSEMILEYGELLSERNQLENDKGKTALRYVHLLAELEQLTRERNAILKSHSWRITAPLRRLVRVLAGRR